ncbi:MAG: zinc-ribbon domain-containing protein [Planctomycetota bacterium]
MHDTTLTCEGCGGSFLFTASEQAYYAERGFQSPKRCRGCRQSRKRGRSDGDGSGRSRSISGSLPAVRPLAPRATFPAYCVDCGGDMRIPFPLQSPPRCPPCFIQEYASS